ncbi:uncharacterized protein BXZ73DRAFT_102503 [Epithele typhae]|uniref:uncharacterized protein n=1 Tax=Epithele typhae TaxID=378194 RepID=UPI0020081688|nr:uncharacterized protein BXZ73DRAFT_102503 [Epithele typhae]KAH9927996.1 hypothetical protein BXZ73DRAFT_102503 [Epithele typhae]
MANYAEYPQYPVQYEQMMDPSILFSIPFDQYQTGWNESAPYANYYSLPGSSYSYDDVASFLRQGEVYGGTGYADASTLPPQNDMAYIDPRLLPDSSGHPQPNPASWMSPQTQSWQPNVHHPWENFGAQIQTAAIPQHQGQPPAPPAHYFSGPRGSSRGASTSASTSTSPTTAPRAPVPTRRDSPSTPKPPHRPRAQPQAKPEPRVWHGDLPRSLKPVIASPPTLPCPVPHCAERLPPTDGAWRVHFARAHHATFVGRPCALPSARCEREHKCACPDPACAARGGRMSVGSLGRHWLNVHVGVRYACPVDGCAVQKLWRHSSCERHVKSCVGRHPEAWARAVREQRAGV